MLGDSERTEVPTIYLNVVAGSVHSHEGRGRPSAVLGGWMMSRFGLSRLVCVVVLFEKCLLGSFCVSRKLLRARRSWNYELTQPGLRRSRGS